MGKKIFIDKKDKIFIAGHNGMVGNSIKETFLRNGYNNLLFEDRKKLDLTNLIKVKEFFEIHRPDVVVLAAAKVGGIVANSKYPTEFILENLKIQTNIIEIAWKYSVKRFLFLGSSCIYPKFSKQPIKEEYLLEGNLEPTNEYYAIAKIAGIKLCQALRKEYNFDAICLMPTNLYGPGDNYDYQNSHVLPAFIRKFYEAKIKELDVVTCWGDGSPLREFLHAEDLGEACLFVLENYFPIVNKHNSDLIHLNVGTGKDITIKELAQIVASLVGFKGKIIWDISKPNGTHQKKLDISAIKKLGWEPKIGLKQGIERTIKEYIMDINNKDFYSI